MTESGYSLQRQKDRCWLMVLQSHHEFQCTDPTQTIPRDSWQHCACVMTFKLLLKKHDVACAFNADSDQKLWILIPWP